MSLQIQDLNSSLIFEDFSMKWASYYLVMKQLITQQKKLHALCLFQLSFFPLYGKGNYQSRLSLQIVPHTISLMSQEKQDLHLPLDPKLSLQTLDDVLLVFFIMIPTLGNKDNYSVIRNISKHLQDITNISTSFQWLFIRGMYDSTRLSNLFLNLDDHVLVLSGLDVINSRFLSRLLSTSIDDRVGRCRCICQSRILQI